MKMILKTITTSRYCFWVSQVLKQLCATEKVLA